MSCGSGAAWVGGPAAAAEAQGVRHALPSLGTFVRSGERARRWMRYLDRVDTARVSCIVKKGPIGLIRRICRRRSWQALRTWPNSC